MTWQELCKKAKEIGCEVENERCISLYSFDTTVNCWKDGELIVNHETCLKRNMKPEQMYVIMEILK